MGKIYSCAKQVIAWLGPARPVANCVQSLRFRVQGLEHPQPPNSSLTLDRYYSWAGLNHRHFIEAVNLYWSRAWIIQEVALARGVLLLWGAAELELHTLDEEQLKKALEAEF